MLISVWIARFQVFGIVATLSFFNILCIHKGTLALSQSHQWVLGCLSVIELAGWTGLESLLVAVENFQSFIISVDDSLDIWLEVHTDLHQKLCNFTDRDLHFLFMSSYFS